jgi:hypothetical protein
LLDKFEAFLFVVGQSSFEKYRVNSVTGVEQRVVSPYFCQTLKNKIITFTTILEKSSFRKHARFIYGSRKTFRRIPILIFLIKIFDFWIVMRDRMLAAFMLNSISHYPKRKRRDPSRIVKLILKPLYNNGVH